MKIKEIKCHDNKIINKKRCQRRVFHSGDGSSPRPSANCRKSAKYSIDGANYCYQHSGELALIYLLDNQN